MVQLFTIGRQKKYKKIFKKDIFLDSGGQYKYGTTDVTEQFVFTTKESIKIFS